MNKKFLKDHIFEYTIKVEWRNILNSFRRYWNLFFLVLLFPILVDAQTIGLNFRATAGLVTDGVNETYSRCQSDLYPVTRAGFTFGWNNFVDMERDRESSIDRRLAGVCQRENNISSQTFRIDLGGTAGQYDISLALGDYYFAGKTYLQVLDSDNTTVLININGVSTTANQYLDATGAVYTSSTWAANQTKVRVTLTGTTAYIRLGQGGADTATTKLAHARFEKVSGASPSPSSSTSVSPSVSPSSASPSASPSSSPPPSLAIPTWIGSGIGTVAKVLGVCPINHAQSVDDPNLCFKLAPAPDQDLDGYPASQDCDDVDPMVWPGEYYSCNSGLGTRLCNNGTWGACVNSSVTPLCEATAGGSCYYIDAGVGSNANSGTFGNPFQTIGKIAGGGTGSIPAFPTTLTPGSVVYLKGSTNFTTTYANLGSVQVFAELNSDGTSVNPILIKRYPGSTAQIIGSGGAAGFKVYGDHVRFEDISITTGIGAGDRVPIFTGGSNGVQVLRSYIYDSGGNGDNNFGCIYANGTNNTTFYGNFLHNCKKGAGNVEGISAVKWLDEVGNGTGANHYSDKNRIWWDTADALNNGDCQRNKHGSSAADVGVNGHRMLRGFCFNSRRVLHTSTAKIRFNDWAIHTSADPIYINACDTGTCADMIDMQIKNNTFVNASAFGWRLPKYVLGENVTFTGNVIIDNRTYVADTGVINIDTYGTDTQKAFLEANNMLTVNNNCYHNTVSTLFFGYYLANSSCVGGGVCANGGRYNFTDWKTNSGQDALSFSENALLDSNYLPTSTNCRTKGWGQSILAGPTPSASTSVATSASASSSASGSVGSSASASASPSASSSVGAAFPSPSGFWYDRFLLRRIIGN